MVEVAIGSGDGLVTDWTTHLVEWGYPARSLLAAPAMGYDVIKARIEAGELAGVIMNRSAGVAPGLRGLVEAVPNAKIIVVADESPFDPRVTEAQPQIEELVLGAPAELDLAMFPNLRRLQVAWRPGCLKNAGIASLDLLCIRKYKGQAEDVRDIPEFARLDALELVQSRIETLAGLERFSGLVSLKLHYNAFLRELGGAALPALKYLTIAQSRKLTGHGAVGRFGRLVLLSLNHCGTMETVAFVDRLPDLRSFIFAGTDVADGNLAPLLRLEHVAFTRKRHFSHRETAFRKAGKELQKLHWLAA